MIRKESKPHGFTMIELIVVFAMIQVLMAIAIPAFTENVKRSKSSEAMGNLNSMFKGAATYYQAEQMGTQTLTANTSGHCIVGTTSLVPTNPGGQKQIYDFQSVPALRAIGFNVSYHVYYGYRVISASATSVCNQAGNSDLYTFRAMGDLDDDNVFSTFELATGSNDNNELYHSSGVYVLQATE